jgi:8-oxo-dGTP diphosphatase
MTSYVVGLVHDGDRVVLVKKNKPEWQAGKLNGVGGKVELGESYQEAMTREFEEETGVRIDNWDYVLTLFAGEHDIAFYGRQVFPETIALARTVEEEEIIVRPYRTLQPWEIIPNLEWIIPLAISNAYQPFEVWEK